MIVKMHDYIKQEKTSPLQRSVSMSEFHELFAPDKMDFNTFRSRFSEPDKSITLEQYRALSLDELNGLIRDAQLSRPDAGQARLFHPSSQQGKTKHHLFFFHRSSPCLLSFLSIVILYYLMLINSCRFHQVLSLVDLEDTAKVLAKLLHQRSRKVYS